MNGYGKFNLESIVLGGDDSTCTLKSISITSHDQQIQLPCQWKPHLYNLETLALSHGWWHDVESLCFPKLKDLYVFNCVRSTLFTISCFRSFQQLQTLYLSDCASLEAIVEDVRNDQHDGIGMDTNTITLFQLDSVTLRDMPNPKNFMHGVSYECYLPALKKVKVDNCGLSSIFTCSIFRNLQQLQELDISKCALLEGIAEDVRGDEHVGMDKKIISLLHLDSVVYKDLPNFKSTFIHGATYECYMPALKNVEVENCGLSLLFTCFVVKNLLQLQRLVISKCALMEEILEDVRGDEHAWIGTKTITLLQLNSVVFSDLPNLKNVFQGANYECYLPALKVVEVRKCGLSLLFTCSVFRNLQQLHELVVSNCRLLVDIVGDGRGDATCDTNDKVITLCQLSSVALVDLPNLRSFSPSVNFLFNYYCDTNCPIKTCEGF